MRAVSSPFRLQLNCLLPSLYGNELQLVYIVALLHKSIVMSAYIVACVVETSCFHCCTDLSRCYGILVCNNTKLKLKKYFFQKPKSTVRLALKCKVCEKSTFLSLCLAKGTVGV
jgi:hypothetical protein